jgi:LuxR family maltose regulon positive regulatory protein
MIKLLWKEYPDQVNNLYLAASRWSEDRGYYQDALEYSMASMYPHNTLKLLEKYYSTGHTDYLGPRIICKYFESIPCEMYGDMPDLCIHYALALAETGQVSIDENELINRGIHFDSATFGGYEKQISQLRAYIALKYENTDDIIRYSEQTLQQFPEHDISDVTPCLILGYIYRSFGNLKKAEFYFSNAFIMSNKVNTVCPGEASESLILSDFYMTSIRYLKGELDDFITPINHLLTENITHKNCMYFCLAGAYYDCGDFEQAYSYVMKGLELCNTYDDIFYEKVKGFILLSKILFYTGKTAECVRVMNEIDSLVKPNCGNLFILLELPRIVNMLTLIGLQERAEAYIQKFQDIKCREAKLTLSEAQSELFLAKNNYNQAIDRLEYIFTNTDLDEYPKKRIDLLIMKSIAYKEYRKDEDALVCLQKALETKGVERYIRDFVDRGKPMHELLIKFTDRAKENKAYNLQNIAEKLVKSFEHKAVLKGHPIEEFERLSCRELEVLRLLAQGFSYQEIGNTLFISLSTVKKHTGNIYDKLKVGNRTQAINIAKANGLVD